MSAREQAAIIIARWLQTGDFPSRMLADIDKDRAFITEMVQGVVRWRRSLEWVRARLVRAAPPPETEAALLVGLYQLLYLDDVEPYAAVNETVDAARNLAGPQTTGLVNAVLRRTIREKDDILSGLAGQHLGVRLSHPDLLLRRWKKAMGEFQMRKLCEWNNTRPDVIISLNLSKISMADFRAKCRQEGIEVTPHTFQRSRSLTLPRGVRVSAVPGYHEGLFFVQDPSCHAGVELLDPQPGMRVLDACAAPGGKTALIADIMKGKGFVAAVDLHADRIAILKENQARLGWENTEVIECDARNAMALKQNANPENGPGFDAILIDAPCSNTGVIRRRPDARWRFSTERLEKLAGSQSALLDACATVLAPGGRMVYSTCSLEQEENEALVSGWVKQHADFRLVKERKLLPPKTQTDGAYIALLTRVE